MNVLLANHLKSISMSQDHVHMIIKNLHHNYNNVAQKKKKSNFALWNITQFVVSLQIIHSELMEIVALLAHKKKSLLLKQDNVKKDY